jgi:hypothetical protein
MRSVSIMPGRLEHRPLMSVRVRQTALRPVSDSTQGDAVRGISRVELQAVAEVAEPLL